MKPSTLLAGCRAALLVGLAVTAARAAPAPEPPPAAPAAPRPLPPAVEATLPTGLRVVVVEHHRRPLLEMALVLPTGTLADPAGGAGTTQLAMQVLADFHEVFADGEPIPYEKSLRRQAIDMGGTADSFAVSDASIITVSGLAADAGAYLTLLADAVERPRHGEESFRSRRDRLLDEMEDLETADPEALGLALQEAAFGADSPYARPGRGIAVDLARLGLEDVEEQQARVLAARGATLVVVGDVQAGKVLAQARKAFRTWTGGEGQRPTVRTPRQVRARRGVVFLRREPATTLTVCAARPLQAVKASGAELEVLAALLGQGFRSRLMNSLREEGGLAYDAWADLVRRRRARALLACAPVAGARADEGVRRFRQVLEELRARPPAEEEVARARALAAAGREAQVERAGGILAAWVEALMLGRREPALEQEQAEIARVTPTALHALARQALAGDSLLWILSGERAAAATAAQANGLGPLRPRSVRQVVPTGAVTEEAGP